MTNRNFGIPIVFIIFARPGQTARVFQAIREAKPATLYVIADGPKNISDALRCQETRKIIDGIDWECSVRKNYSETNLGLRERIISGLDWVFETEENAIILEDDCLPHPTFFHFCEDLLSYYRDDRRVMHISGDNFFLERQIVRESYYYSRVAHVWGWATWKRAWELFHRWDYKDNPLREELFQNRFEKEYWLTILEQLRKGEQEYTWDYQWALTCMGYLSKCIVPGRNLMSNIGFGVNATNTKTKSSAAGNLQTYEMQFPLRHPREVKWNDYADRIIASKYFHGHVIWERKFSSWKLMKWLTRMVSHLIK